MYEAQGYSTREVFKKQSLFSRYYFPFTIPLVKCFHVPILIVWVYQNSPEWWKCMYVCKDWSDQVQESCCCLWLLMISLISHKFLTFSLSGPGRVCTGSPAACPRPPAAPPPPPHPPSSRPSLSSAARSRHTYTHPRSWSLNKKLGLWRFSFHPFVIVLSARRKR